MKAARKRLVTDKSTTRSQDAGLKRYNVDINYWTITEIKLIRKAYESLQKGSGTGIPQRLMKEGSAIPFSST